MKRIAYLLMFCAAALLVGCKEPPSDSGGVGFVRAGQDIEIESVRTYGATDTASDPNTSYYIVKFKFTNHLGIDFVPRVDHFLIEDPAKRRYYGLESGSTVLVGISNYSGVLKQGDTHEYTAGFRVPLNTQGMLLYDATL